MKRLMSISFMLGLALLACKTTKTSKEIESLAPSNGNGVIIGQIIEISDERAESYPCNKVPCMAKVKIESVEKRAGRSIQPFAANQEGNMRFVFSLNETDVELFPNLDKRFPGLKKGDRFRANVNQEQLIGDKTQWVAYEYILLH